VPHPLVCKGAGFDFVFDLVSLGFWPENVDAYQSSVNPFVETPTAPRPVSRMRYQPSLHGIPVHIVQLFSHLLLAPHVEVIKPPLPERPRTSLVFRKRKLYLLPRAGSPSAQRSGNLGTDGTFPDILPGCPTLGS
jgi:hypothetical protein